MEVLLVTLELSPYAVAGPAGECVAALGRALCQLGHGVTVAMPRAEGFEAHGLMVARRLTPLNLGDGEHVTVYDGQLPSNVRVVLFDSPKLESRSGVFADDGVPHADLWQRVATLCRAAAAFAEQRAGQGNPFEVVHAHGWAAAAVTALSPLPSVFTFYDPSERAECDAAELAHFALPEESLPKFLVGQGASLLLGGMSCARLVTTISSELAARATDVEFAGAVGARLREVGVKTVAVLPGLDYAIYNPATDSAIPTRYDAESALGKANCKAQVCKELELEIDADLPLVVFAQPATLATGADLLVTSVLALCKGPVQLVVAGSGDAALSKAFAAPKLARLPNFRFLDRWSPELERRLLSAADIALCPNREPQLGTHLRAAQRYGAVPVALATPLAVDTVIDCPRELSSGTGFLFDEPSGDSLRAGVERALAAFHDEAFPLLRRRIMRLDLGWERAARRYAQLYKVITSDSHPLHG